MHYDTYEDLLNDVQAARQEWADAMQKREQQLLRGLEERYGWVRGSKTASRYVAVFGKDSERKTAKAWGKETKEQAEPDPMDPITCPRCDKETPRDKDLCVWCGQGLEPGEAEVADKIESELLSSITEAESDEQIENRVNLLEKFKESPERRAELVDEFAADLD